MLSVRENEEIKNSEDKNIKKLREEFNKKQSNNENHPKTSHGNKHPINNYNNFYSSGNSSKKTPSRYSKALSANKYNQKININKNNNIKLNAKITYDFCKKHPGFLYYKEIISSQKNNKNKKRTLTGKVINRKIKLDPVQKYIPSNRIVSNKMKKNEKFPKINTNYNNNKMNGKQTYYNHNYNYNNIKNDKNNPYSIFWANKILNQSDLKIEIKGKSYGVPKLVTATKNDDFLFKVFNRQKDAENKLENSTKNSYKSVNNMMNGNNKHFYNNFVGITNQKKEKNTKKVFDDNKGLKNNEKCYKIKNEDNNDNKQEMKNLFSDEINDKKEENNNKNKDDNNNDVENDYDNESLDEEQQKQFYKNQKNFFKARKDIMEEPEYLEEDNDSQDLIVGDGGKNS